MSASVKCVRTESAIRLIGLDGLQVMLNSRQEQHRDRETHGKLRHPGGLWTVVSMGAERVSVGRLRGHTSTCVSGSVRLLSYLWFPSGTYLTLKSQQTKNTHRDTPLGLPLFTTHTHSTLSTVHCGVQHTHTRTHRGSGLVFVLINKPQYMHE